MASLDEAAIARIIGRLRGDSSQLSVVASQQAALHNIEFDESRGLFVPFDTPDAYSTYTNAATLPPLDLNKLKEVWKQFEDERNNIAEYVAFNPYHWEDIKSRLMQYPGRHDSNHFNGIKIHIDTDLDYGKWYVQYPNRREHYPKEESNG